MSSDDGDDAVITIKNVIDSIGIEIYKYLYPQELFSFSLSNQHVYHGISKGIIQACLRQLPPNFGSSGGNDDYFYCRYFRKKGTI